MEARQPLPWQTRHPHHASRRTIAPFIAYFSTATISTRLPPTIFTHRRRALREAVWGGKRTADLENGGTLDAGRGGERVGPKMGESITDNSTIFAPANTCAAQRRPQARYPFRRKPLIVLGSSPKPVALNQSIGGLNGDCICICIFIFESYCGPCRYRGAARSYALRCFSASCVMLLASLVRLDNLRTSKLHCRTALAWLFVVSVAPPA